MAEKTTALARAGCSTKEHIRAIDGTVLVEEASNLHAGPCQPEMDEIKVAQNALCLAAFPGLAISRQRIDTHRRSSKKVREEPPFKSVSRQTSTHFDSLGSFRIDKISEINLCWP